MGGAQRNQRKRKQQRSSQATKAIASARGRNATRNKTIAGVVVVVVIAAAIIAGVLVTNSNKQAQINSVIPAAQAEHQYPTRLVGGGVVLAGKNSAKIKLDFYEDFMCPACGAFFNSSHGAVANALAQGKIQVRFHMLDFLNDKSNPPGYSLRAASASLAAAEQGRFADFYASLYEKQPGEGSAGYTNAQLISLGKRLDIGGSFVKDIKNDKYNQAVKTDYAKSVKAVAAFYKNKYNMQYFATPSVMYQGKVLDVSPRRNVQTGELKAGPWLQDLLHGKVDVMPKPKR